MTTTAATPLAARRDAAEQRHQALKLCKQAGSALSVAGVALVLVGLAASTAIEGIGILAVAFGLLANVTWLSVATRWRRRAQRMIGQRVHVQNDDGTTTGGHVEAFDTRGFQVRTDAGDSITAPRWRLS